MNDFSIYKEKKKYKKIENLNYNLIDRIIFIIIFF